MTRTPAAPFRFTVDHWAALWANPHPQLAGRVVTPDVVVHWPGAAEPVRGVTAYKQRIAEMLDRIPDLRLTVTEHAGNGDFLFVRWTVHGTDVNRSVQLSGVDRLHLRDGLVKEIRIYCDPRLLPAFAGPPPGRS
jgi:SnoaL-like polyketide cyclase